MAEALSINSTLSTLYLSGNEVWDEGAVRLAEALTTNSTLTTLNLIANKFGDEGAKRLAEALAINSSLTQLQMNCDLNTRRLVDAHLDRNKANQVKKSASLFFWS